MKDELQTRTVNGGVEAWSFLSGAFVGGGGMSLAVGRYKIGLVMMITALAPTVLTFKVKHGL